jgi:signal transduction histidine kinase
MVHSRVLAAAHAVFRGESPARTLRRHLTKARERERELEALLRESERQRAELELRVDRLSRVGGSVAHDVNNLLGVVSLVGSGLRDRLPAAARELADEMCEAALRAAKLNRQLLTMIREDREPIGNTVDVNSVIEGMQRVLERLTGTSLELVVDLAKEPCVVYADPAQLERVILNLVTNARDAMPRKGRVTIETAHAVSSQAGDPRREAVVVRVSDTGVGIDTVTRRRMFEPFFTTKGTEGSGTGLATVKDIVASCGGRVEVESQPGGGTRFEVVLPVTPVNPAGGTRQASAPSTV